MHYFSPNSSPRSGYFQPWVENPQQRWCWNGWVQNPLAFKRSIIIVSRNTILSRNFKMKWNIEKHVTQHLTVDTILCG